MSGAKSPEPCEAYFGNLCGGFGGSLTCMACGWDRSEHPEEVAQLEKMHRFLAEAMHRPLKPKMRVFRRKHYESHPGGWPAVNWWAISCPDHPGYTWGSVSWKAAMQAAWIHISGFHSWPGEVDDDLPPF